MISTAGRFRYQDVEDHIRGLVETGALLPGDKLPSLRSLSSRLAVSVSTVNQAYVEMERKGLVEARAPPPSHDPQITSFWSVKRSSLSSS